ncbi:MAG: SDR family oxidoreductase [Gammaproteobacteria bacterium]|nr:SDR family oxidoreductase [Gammaproteobacteria bacterium]
MFINQVIWITGASSGIGEAVAKQFIAQGARLILSARNENKLQELKEKCITNGAKTEHVLVLPLDMEKPEAFAAAHETVIRQFGQLDMLFNNAGISQRSLCKDTDISVYRTLFEVDFFGQIALTKAVLPLMIEKNAGHLVVTSSVAGKIGVPFRTGYCAAKHAVMGFFDALRAEVINNNIRVTTITPGFIQTNLSKNALNSDGSKFGITDADIAKGIDVDVCAKRIIDGLTKGKKEILIAGMRERLALLMKRFFPKILFKMVAAIKAIPEKVPN